MGRIALLPDEVASQVAAGEVVERPASVVKELVENSLDAGATRIEIAVAKGGSSLVRVVDNGIGMDRDDALLSLERHATSKIRTGNDLASIHTLGFRGEALPSIASVSRFRLATRPADAIEGTEILVNGGKIDTVRACGEAPGTLIEVKHLFYNLPARRKFLRTENTESSHVQHQLMLQAVGHPEVGFVFLRDQTVIFQLPPTQSLATRISDLRGEEIIKRVVEIEPTTTDGISIRGFLGKAGVSRPTRAEQIIFVNGRAVENLTIQHALREGYHTALMKGQYPLVFLFLDLDPADVDVNVHPAKREVRFRNPDVIRQALAETVRKTLDSDRGNWSRAFTSPRSAPATDSADFAPSPPLASLARSEPVAPLVPVAEQFALRKDWHEFPQPQQKQDGLATPAIFRPETAVSVSPDLRPVASPTIFPVEGQGTPSSEFRLLGVLGKLYILMENGEGLVLVDQHAAHERILFERLRRETETAGVPCQRLLIPIVLRLPPKDFDWLLLNAPSLQRMGFSVEPFGESTLKIDGIPQFLKMEDPANTIRQLVDELRSLTSSTSRLRLGEDVIAKTVCRYAVKANDLLHSAEIGQLVKDLLACELPYCCPHGRPTMIQIGYSELEKKFGRKV
ncbi:MAG: DNA mismatch repair endonuclease MutL [Chthoniobacterales bacterium]